MRGDGGEKMALETQHYFQKIKTSRQLMATSLICFFSCAPWNGQAWAANETAIIFEDHFQGGEVDASSWVVQKSAGTDQHTAKAQIQMYLPEAVRTGDGLHVIADHASVDDAKTGVHFDFSSGRLQTKRAFLYGRFEFRAKLPRGRGLWPALWLRTPIDGKPMNGEIDVLEGFGSHPNIVQSMLHPWVQGKESHPYCTYLSVQPKPDSPRFHNSTCTRVARFLKDPNEDLASDYHLYAVEWRSDHITWSIDGTPYFTVREEIPHLPMIIVIYMAISPHWDGAPDKSLVLPQSLDVRDVVVYR